MKLFKYMAVSLCLTLPLGAADAQKTSSKELQNTYNEVKAMFTELSPKVIRPAEGYLKYPYLIPAGFYQQMWDWDGFFMGSYFCTKGKPEYLKYWALNFFANIDDKGYVSGCATTKGPRPIFGDFSMKPFLAQGTLIASETMNDFEWVRPYYDKLKLSLDYREKIQQDKATGLFFWQNGFQSGADNNIALNIFEQDTRRFLACDASTLQEREYKALAVIARHLGFDNDAADYSQRAVKLAAAINKYLWCDADKMYYNVEIGTGKWYKRVSYSNFWPLFDRLASVKDGQAMLKKYLLNPNYMKAAYGFRSLSASDPDYNNKNIIVPFSNWQGPIWINANYIQAMTLKLYGMEKEIPWLAQTLSKMLLSDYKANGSLHESYNADTGEPLAPDKSYVDKEGKFIGFISWDLCLEEVFQGLVDNHWNTLEIK
jgi:alpha,alpha-trehalase